MARATRRRLAWLAVALSCAPIPLALADQGALVRPLGEAEVDWQMGVVRAKAGASADHRMPTPDMARPGAERRARERAKAKLRAALATLPLGNGRTPAPTVVEAALARAEAVDIEYQSDGGVTLALAVPFEVLSEEPAGRPRDAGVEAKPTPRALAVAAAPFEATPVVACGDREATVRAASYRVGAPPSGQPVTTARHHRRRLVLAEGACADLDGFANAKVVIYVQKVMR